MNHLYFIHFTHAISVPVQFPMLSTSWKFNAELYSRTQKTQRCEKVRCWNSRLKWGCDASREIETPFCSWLFAGFPPPSTPCSGFRGILEPLNLEQLKTKTEMSCQCPGASLTRRAALERAGCAEQHTEEMGHLLMSLRSPSWLHSKGSTRLLHGALMTFIMTAEQKWCFYEVIIHCQRSQLIEPNCN